MRSAEVAAEAGVNVQTLRYYERRELLPEPERLESGYRAWDAETVRVVRFVKRAQRRGFTLEEIDSLLGLAAGGPDRCEAARELASEKIAELDEKLAALAVMRQSLLALVDSCARPRQSAPVRFWRRSRLRSMTGERPIAVGSDRMPLVRLLHVPGCPLVERVRITLQACLLDAGITVTIEDVEGPYPSPTLVIDGIDVTTGAPPAGNPSCRLDLPARGQILEALRASRS